MLFSGRHSKCRTRWRSSDCSGGAVAVGWQWCGSGGVAVMWWFNGVAVQWCGCAMVVWHGGAMVWWCSSLGVMVVW